MRKAGCSALVFVMATLAILAPTASACTRPPPRYAEHDLVVNDAQGTTLASWPAGTQQVWGSMPHVDFDGIHLVWDGQLRDIENQTSAPALGRVLRLDHERVIWGVPVDGMGFTVTVWDLTAPGWPAAHPAGPVTFERTVGPGAGVASTKALSAIRTNASDGASASIGLRVFDINTASWMGPRATVPAEPVTMLASSTWLGLLAAPQGTGQAMQLWGVDLANGTVHGPYDVPAKSSLRLVATSVAAVDSIRADQPTPSYGWGSDCGMNVSPPVTDAHVLDLRDGSSATAEGALAKERNVAARFDVDAKGRTLRFVEVPGGTPTPGRPGPGISTATTSGSPLTDTGTATALPDDVAARPLPVLALAGAVAATVGAAWLRRRLTP